MRTGVAGCALFCACFGLAAAASADTISLPTSASVSATYGPTAQSFGPFPWSDFGITAAAAVSPNTLHASVGGATAFSLSGVAGGEQFGPSSVLDVTYDPNWQGAITSNAQGSLGSSLAWSLGPFNGSLPLLNVPLSTSVSGNTLGAALDSGSALTAANSTQGPAVTGGLNMEGDVCFISCSKLVSASVNLTVGTRIDQSVTATPSVTYGDWLWYSQSGTATTAVSSQGSGGTIANALGTPGLSLSNGDTFDLNLLPFVQLSMPITNMADVALPADLSASYYLLGASGSYDFPLGDLYLLSTGPETFDLNASWYAGDYFSIPLEYSTYCPGVACFASYTTPPVSDPITFQTGGLPANIPAGTMPPATIGLLGSGGASGGYGISNLGSLVACSPDDAEACCPPATADVGDCINRVSISGSVPEPDTIVLLLTGLIGLAWAAGSRRDRGAGGWRYRRAVPPLPRASSAVRRDARRAR